MSRKGLRVEFQLPSQRTAKEAPPAQVKDPVPRIARLLSLAHKWEGMVRRGEVKDYAEIARRMGLSRARVSQVCKLALLAPQIQEYLLLQMAHKLASERHLRVVHITTLWNLQIRLFE